MKKNVINILLLMVFLPLSSLRAQQGYEKNNQIFRLGVESRFDYVNNALAGDVISENSGFKVQYFNLRIDGQITPKFSYSWRQRFNKVNSASDFADNTDWLFLTFRPTQNWSLSAGKQVVMIGGWEYDCAPIDVYFASEYWNNVNCYQLGASVAYTTNKANDTFTFQVCQSPYHKGINNYQDGKKMADLYAYNLFWMGTHGFYTALHSINFSEYQRGKFDAYIVLGNQFKFGDATIQLDFMDYGTSAKELLFRNFSIMGKVDYLIAQRVNVFAKSTYDKVGSGYPAGLFVYPGTEMIRVGGGVEYYPLGAKQNKDIRIHAMYAYSMGTNTNPGGTALDRGSYLSVGLTWKIDLIEAAKKMIDLHLSKKAE